MCNFQAHGTRARQNGKELFDVFVAISARASGQFARYLRVPCYFATPCPAFYLNFHAVSLSLSLSLSFPLSRVPPFTIFSLAPPLPLSRVSSELFLVTTTRHGLRKYSVSVPLASISIRLFRVPFSLLKQRVLVFDRAARFTWQRGGNLPRPAIKVGYETRTVLICQNTQNACRQTLPPPARFFSQTRGLCFTLYVTCNSVFNPCNFCVYCCFSTYAFKYVLS